MQYVARDWPVKADTGQGMAARQATIEDAISHLRATGWTIDANYGSCLPTSKNFWLTLPGFEPIGGFVVHGQTDLGAADGVHDDARLLVLALRNSPSDGDCCHLISVLADIAVADRQVYSATMCAPAAILFSGPVDACIRALAAEYVSGSADQAAEATQKQRM